MFDVCLIGAGGIVGAAIAREVAQSGRSIVAFEKHSSACRETSGLNSRVIHSGFHEAHGTLKSELAREGSRLIINYAEKRKIKILKSGMLIAVPHGGIREGLWRESGELWNLWREARRTDVPFNFVFTPNNVRKIAPIEALGGIFIPSVCVLDVEATVESLLQDAEEAGARFFYESPVTGMEVLNSGYTLTTTVGETVQARALVNSAGLSAHEISLMAGGPSYGIDFLRGDYYELIGGSARWKIQTLVYPAMPRGSPSKGIHFGPRTDGKLYIGPSVTSQEEPMSIDLFVRAGRKFLPQLRATDLRWAYAGIRPKHVTNSGASDFVIRLDRKDPPLINLIGIDSPGLSASMAIARRVIGMIP